MEALVDSIVEFIKVRQLNFAVAALLTICYLVYQYWGLMFREKLELEDCAHSKHRLGSSRSRSRSRSRTRSGNYHDKMDKQRRSGGRRAYGRCPDCSKCNLEAAK